MQLEDAGDLAVHWEKFSAGIFKMYRSSIYKNIYFKMVNFIHFINLTIVSTMNIIYHIYRTYLV